MPAFARSLGLLSTPKKALPGTTGKLEQSLSKISISIRILYRARRCPLPSFVFKFIQSKPMYPSDPVPSPEDLRKQSVSKRRSFPPSPMETPKNPRKVRRSRRSLDACGTGVMPDASLRLVCLLFARENCVCATRPSAVYVCMPRGSLVCSSFVRRKDVGH